MSENYYLNQKSKSKVEKYTYEYDKFEDSMSNSTKYYVDIVFENDEFVRLDFGDNRRKRFDDNLRPKEIDLINKIQEEIKKIKEQREKEKYDILKIKLKDTKEQVELLNAMAEGLPKAVDTFKAVFSPIMKMILDNIKINKIPFDKLNIPSVKVKVPLEYEVEIFNPNLSQNQEKNSVGQGPI